MTTKAQLDHEAGCYLMDEGRRLKVVGALKAARAGRKASRKRAKAARRRNR